LGFVTIAGLLLMLLLRTPSPPPGSPAATTPWPEQHRRRGRVNVAGFFYMTWRAVPEMEKHGSGHIVQITTNGAGVNREGVVHTMVQ
jgi:NAD(P)-dependent dehydrogenase (short-subunit alcohol dehydrogenase family)